MAGMFSDSEFNGDISKWNVSSLRVSCFMFKNSPFDGDISNWNVPSTANLAHMFFRSRLEGRVQWKCPPERTAPAPPMRLSLRSLQNRPGG